MTYALYEVSTKALITYENKILTLTTHRGYVDFPGGRIDDTEYGLPFQEALKREIAEELGYNGKTSIGRVVMCSNRTYDLDGTIHHVVGVFYDVKIQHSIELSISDEHKRLEWLTPRELLLRKDHFVSQDEYQQFKNFFLASSTTPNPEGLYKWLLYIQPKNYALQSPVVDTITKHMIAAYRQSIKGELLDSGEIINKASFGFHKCICGALSDNTEHVLADLSAQTNSLCIHYLAYHRDEVPQKDLDFVANLPFGEAEPAEAELSGTLPLGKSLQYR